MRKIVAWSMVMVSLIAFAACGGGGDGKTVKLYGVIHGKANAGNSVLVMLSPDDGSFMRTIGSIGNYISGLEYDAVNNKLYGTIANYSSTYGGWLIEIDMNTAFATTIGPAGVPINRPTVNSTGEMFAWNGNDSWLLTVDTGSGLATTVGDCGFSNNRHGLAFDNEDTLYLVRNNGDIYTLDSVSASATYVSTIGTTALNGDFHPETGHYWGIDKNWQGIGTPMNLLVVDVNTPAILDSLSTVDDLHAITFYYD